MDRVKEGLPQVKKIRPNSGVMEPDPQAIRLSEKVDLQGQFFFSAYGRDQETAPVYGALLLYMDARDHAVQSLRIDHIDMDHEDIEMLHFSPLTIDFDEESRKALRSVSFVLSDPGKDNQGMHEVKITLSGVAQTKDGREQFFHDSLCIPCGPHQMR